MNTDLMTTIELSRLIGAQVLQFSANHGFSSAAIDSRNVKEGSLFFALEGSVCDGHNFVKSAFDNGAAAAMVDSSKIKRFNILTLAENAKKDLIVVDNTLKGLQDSARVYLEKFPKLLKIGITGSSGKTTTKEIAASIISREKNTFMSRGNLNSETGLSLSAFEIRAYHEVGIFELGMNRKNEILENAFILKPNIALITNIGSAHIENFGSRTEILNEKKNIFKYLGADDTALIPANDEYAEELGRGISGNVKFYGESTLKEIEGIRSLGLEGSEIIWEGEKIHFALPGKHNLEDAAAAIAIAKEIPVRSEAVKQGLESVKPIFGRTEIIKGRTTVIQDCYNANPESAAKAIEFCDSVDWQGRKIYVLADMLELGDSSRDAHLNLGKLLEKSTVDKVFLFGSEIKTAAEYLTDKDKKYFYTNDINELSFILESFVQAGDFVLLKGSRGLALERLTKMLTGEIV